MRKLVLRGGAFLALLAVILFFSSVPFRIEEYRIGETYEELYTSEPNTFDGVVIGGSNTYSYWEPTIAWRDYGMTVFNMGIPNMQMSSARYVIEEARKTQPDALYIITANSFKWRWGSTKIHYATDYMRLSSTKVNAINAMSDIAGYGLKRIAFFFPILQFHAKWSTLPSIAYDPQYEHVKAGATYSVYLDYVEDVTGKFVTTDKRVALKPAFEENMEDLFAYLKDNDVRVLFVRLPQAIEDEERIAQINTVCDMIQEEGFDFLDLQDKVEEIGFNTATDFYNGRHANVRGSIKFTDYLARYLKDTYGFEDKRGQADLADWDVAAERYDALLKTRVFDFELSRAPRDASLTMSPVSVVAQGDGARVTWTEVPGADTYLVYRRQTPAEGFADVILRDDLPDYTWQQVATCDPGTLSYEEAGLLPATTYAYAVVPVSHEGETERYGMFKTSGTSLTTAGDAA